VPDSPPADDPVEAAENAMREDGADRVTSAVAGLGVGGFGVVTTLNA
jgi:hypothetical protein